MCLVAQDTWGNFRFPEEINQSKNRFGFTGYIFDPETDLYYAKARYYDAEFGRFTTQDSFLGNTDEPPSLHRYIYANANPTTFVDPTGHIAILTKVQERLKDTREQLIDSAQDFSDYVGAQLPDAAKPLQNRISKPISQLVGGLAGLTGLADRAVGAANWAANAAVATVAPNSQLALEAGQETNDLIESTTEALHAIEVAGGRAAVMVVEDPLGAAGTAMQMAQAGAQKTLELAVALANSDPGATASATAVGTELAADIVIGAKGAGVGRSLLHSAERQVDEFAGAAGRVLREGAEHLPLRYSVNPGAHLGNLRLRGAGRSGRPSSLEYNIAPHGQQPSPRRGFASHHGVQQEYLKRNVPGYDPKLDPTMLLDDAPGGPHKRITGEQATRRARVYRSVGSKYGSDYGSERAVAIDQLRRVGVPEEKIGQWVLEHDAYLFEIDRNR